MRPLTFTVKPFPDPQLGRLYRLEVMRFEKSSKPPGILTLFRNLTRSQEGRMHEYVFPLTAHPQGPTADFLRACGVNPTPDTTIRTSQLIGAILGARFRQAEDGTYVICQFEPLETPEKNARSEQEPASGKPPVQQEKS